LQVGQYCSAILATNWVAYLHALILEGAAAEDWHEAAADGAPPDQLLDLRLRRLGALERAMKSQIRFDDFII